MSLLEVSALAVVVVAGLYLLALGFVSLFSPRSASRFLLGFASSRALHFTEMIIRIVVGAALVLCSPRMLQPVAFGIFGWVLIATSTVLVFVPWHWHRRLAQQAVPLFTRYIAWIGLVSLAVGGFMLSAVAGGMAA